MKRILIFGLLALSLNDVCGKEETEWKEVLLYGIDTEVLQVLEQIRSSKDASLNNELVDVLKQTVSNDVKIAILGYFTDVNEEKGQQTAVDILTNYEDTNEKLIISVLRYLSMLESTESLPLFEELVTHPEIGVASAALRGLGRILDSSGNSSRSLPPDYSRESVEVFLLEKFKSRDLDEALRPEIILTLGKIGGELSVERLLEIVRDRQEEKLLRLYATDSLGKIADPKAIPALRELYLENDSLIRAYAASALAEFDTAEVMDILMQGLKDSSWRVRETSAKGLANPRSAEAMDILIYKARKDPVRNVRVEAIKALGEIGRKKSLDFLREMYEDEAQRLDIRIASFDVLVKKDLNATLPSVEKILEQELAKPAYQAKVLEHTGKSLDGIENSSLKKIFQRMLDAADPIVRIHGIRGIATNRFEDLKDRLQSISENESHGAVKREAQTALSKW